MMESSQQIVCKDLLTYLQDLPAVVIVGLYQHSAACLAVFRLAGFHDVGT